MISGYFLIRIYPNFKKMLNHRIQLPYHLVLNIDLSFLPFSFSRTEAR